jgi:hypothetical protein
MATTAGDLIRGALRLLQVNSADVTLSADEMNSGLVSLNQMLDGWSNEGLLQNEVVRESFALTPGHNPHTWGATGDFASSHPIQVLAASLHIGSSPSVDIFLQQVSYDAYENIALKGLVTNYPQVFYIDMNHPNANVYLYPVPGSATINFESYKPFAQYTDQADTLSLRPGYLRALRYNLALELAPEYQISAGADVVAIARQSIQKIKNINYKATIPKIDPVLVKIGRGRGFRYNPYSDTFN